MTTATGSAESATGESAINLRIQASGSEEMSDFAPPAALVTAAPKMG
jgi:hypothetical protein